MNNLHSQKDVYLSQEMLFLIICLSKILHETQKYEWMGFAIGNFWMNSLKDTSKYLVHKTI